MPHRVQLHAAALAGILTLPGGCGRESASAPSPAPAPASDSAPSGPDSGSREAALQVAIEKIYWDYLDDHPTHAVSLGLHGKDGALPDLSPQGLKAMRDRIADARETLTAFEDVSGRLGLDRAALASALETEHFEVEISRRPWLNPMVYLEPLDLTPYLSRDYAPVADRAKAIREIATGAPRLLAHGRENLQEPMARPFLETAQLQTRGLKSFVEGDVSAFVTGLEDATLRARVQKSLGPMVAALEEYDAFIGTRLQNASDNYALGAERFRTLLATTQGIDIEIERLRELGQQDLARNRAALEAAAREFDPKATVGEVLARIDADRPAADGLVAEATRQAAELRQFVESHALVSIVRDDPVQVTLTPPFMRWNFAFLDAAGALEPPRRDAESKPLPSFYYISPPDPTWTAERRDRYVPSRADLRFVTIHEVWPGHFLHALHIRQNPSTILKSFWNYATGEGWAHYTEEMMWEAGVSQEPADHIGQIRNALLRNVRYLASIGLHTEGWTVERAEAMFVEQAFQDPQTAHQQAVRGTFDPLYLVYTLGKLAIQKLRDDVKARDEAQGRTFSLRAFHDAFLSHGAAPLPAIRRSMLGPDAGPIL